MKNPTQRNKNIIDSTSKWMQSDLVNAIRSATEEFKNEFHARFKQWCKEQEIQVSENGFNHVEVMSEDDVEGIWTSELDKMLVRACDKFCSEYRPDDQLYTDLRTENIKAIDLLLKTLTRMREKILSLPE